MRRAWLGCALLLALLCPAGPVVAQDDETIFGMMESPARGGSATAQDIILLVQYSANTIGKRTAAQKRQVAVDMVSFLKRGEEAQPLVDAFEMAAQSAMGRKDADAVQFLYQLSGWALDWSDRKDAAITVRKQGLSIVEDIAGGESEIALLARSSLADSLKDAGRSDEAAGYYRRNVEYHVTHKTILSRGGLSDLYGLMSVLEEEGSYQEALNYLDPQVDLMRGLWTASGGSVEGQVTSEQSAAGQLYASTLVRRAGLLSMLDRRGEADAAFREALALRRHLTGEQSHDTGNSYNQMAYFWNIEHRFAEAEPMARKAVEIWEQTEGDQDIATAKARYNYATALLGQGRAAEALPYYEAALPIQLKTGPEDHPDLAILLTTTARALSMVTGRTEEAFATAQRGAAIVRQRRDRRLGGSGAGGAADAASVALARAVARDQKSDPLSGAYDMVLTAAWADSGAAAKMSAAFIAAQDLTLSGSAQAMADAAARNITGDAQLQALIRERQDRVEVLTALDARYRTALSRGDSGAVAALHGAMDEAAAGLQALDSRIDAAFPDYGQLVAPRAASISQVQKQLGKDEALLLLLPSDGHYYSFAISRHAVSWHRADGAAAEIAALTQRLKCRIDEATCSDAEYEGVAAAEARGQASPIDDYYPRYDRAAAYRLYQSVVQPVEPALAGAARVYTVVSGALGGLPLQVLVTAPPEGDAEDGSPDVLKHTPWLGERYAFATLPAVSALTLAHRAEGKTQNLFIGYGAPALVGNGQAAARGGAEGMRRGHVRGAAPLRSGDYYRGVDGAGGGMANVDMLRHLAPLPGTERELRALGSAASARPVIHLGDDATEQAVKTDAQLAQANVIVFATHGLLPSEGRIGEPGLVLTPPAQASAANDGLLTASEAAGLSLNADWLILSACNTATADGSAGSDALSGLARSFLYAGARNLLASHWRVSDDATAALTVETLKADRARRETRAQALQAAEQAIRTGVRSDGSAVDGWQPFWAHPAAWAPFSLITNRDE